MLHEKLRPHLFPGVSYLSIFTRMLMLSSCCMRAKISHYVKFIMFERFYMT